ncbi:tRNA 5-carboxymethoxyuridine methyltransferase [Vibrio stylophorae]|uniref:tRNA 5-carboxymethoxyuridine methyltransferase n=1 Tax=Vibrio stylophorae TaxID=659351 RepID=A0ABN8DSV3_9VIBR|nr:tRNA uridine 5-oxyacetic acid(34) methyltransferase CmoM [Vibrio stylophorae]CAH0533633.1 tRNA 5-carboxymethoxyuridine methyltransferase [Vibrio stylophorae]
MNQDRNFDDIAHKFAKNIYGSGKGDIRQAVLWRDLEQILATLPKRPLRILDAGGGVGQMSQRLAALGHHVILCDISEQMLNLAKEAVTEAGLTEQYEFVHAPAQSIGEHLSAPVDLILFHAVVEWLADPESAVTHLTQQLAPGGILSLMFYNHHGLVFKNLICGNIRHIQEGMPYRKRFKLQPQKGIVPETAYGWLTNQGLNILGRSGVRCFHDYMRDTRVGEYTFDELLSMELALCQQEPYLSLGRYIHCWAQVAAE